MWFFFCINFFLLLLLVTGVGVGLMSVMVPLYIAETAPTHLRGALGSVNQFMICFGIALVNAIGLPIVENPDWWKVMIILTGIPLLVVLAGLLIVGRETPFWLVSRGRE
jgi:MFS family permease